MKKSIAGYNANQFVEDEHVFIKGEGTWFFDKKDAQKSVNQNSVGVHTDTKTINGYTLFQTHESNVWN